MHFSVNSHEIQNWETQNLTGSDVFSMLSTFFCLAVWLLLYHVTIGYKRPIDFPCTVVCNSQFISFKKKYHRLKKVRALDSDEDDEEESTEPINERQFIEHQLFEGEQEEGGDFSVSSISDGIHFFSVYILYYPVCIFAYIHQH